MFTISYKLRGEPQVKTLDTREEVFSFLKTLVLHGPYYSWSGTLDQAIDELFLDVSMNPNDTKGYSYFGETSRRDLFITEDGKVFDPRLFRREIEQAKPYVEPRKPKGESHSYEGRGKIYPRRPKFRRNLADRELEQEILREWGLRPTISNKHWWWWEPEYCGGSRSWKNQTRSRKQWGKKKQNPIKRGYAQRVYPEETELLAEE